MKRSTELERLVTEWFAAFSSGDGAWFDRYISHDDVVRLVGTDPGDWQEGLRVAEFLSSSVQSLAGSVAISPREPVAFASGDVGWAIDRPTLRLSDGKDIDLRWSAVFRREDGEWRAVQIHASVGTPDAELLGTDVDV